MAKKLTLPHWEFEPQIFEQNFPAQAVVHGLTEIKT